MQKNQVIRFLLKWRSRILTSSCAQRRGSMAVNPPDTIPARGFAYQSDSEDQKRIGEVNM
jgi:hypothetical protein